MSLLEERKRGLTDPAMAAKIMAEIPDQPLDTQRKMCYFVEPRGRRLTEYEIMNCYSQPTPDWINGGLIGVIGRRSSTAAVHPGAMKLLNCYPVIGISIVIRQHAGIQCMLKLKVKTGSYCSALWKAFRQKVRCARWIHTGVILSCRRI